MESQPDTFRSRFPVLETTILAAKSCPGFEEYIKGKKPEDMTADERTCILDNFLYPLLQTVHEGHYRAGIMEEIEHLTRLNKGS